MEKVWLSNLIALVHLILWLDITWHLELQAMAPCSAPFRTDSRKLDTEYRDIELQRSILDIKRQYRYNLDLFRKIQILNNYRNYKGFNFISASVLASNFQLY
jgi:hypothetical protein